MFKKIKEFFFGKPVETVVEIPYKVEAPVIEVKVVEEEVPTKVKKPRKPRTPKAVKTAKKSGKKVN